MNTDYRSREFSSRQDFQISKTLSEPSIKLLWMRSWKEVTRRRRKYTKCWEQSRDGSRLRWRLNLLCREEIRLTSVMSYSQRWRMRKNGIKWQFSSRISLIREWRASKKTRRNRSWEGWRARWTMSQEWRHQSWRSRSAWIRRLTCCWRRLVLSRKNHLLDLWIEWTQLRSRALKLSQQWSKKQKWWRLKLVRLRLLWIC